MPRFLFIIDKISSVLAVLAGAMLLILVADMMYEVISRRAFSAPTLWAYDIAVSYTQLTLPTIYSV